MSENAYTIGIDYGTLSGRAVLVNTRNGEIVTSSVLEYPHAHWLPVNQQVVTISFRMR